MKVYGYVRISTNEQKSGYGIESQTSRILEYCVDNELPEPQIIVEQGSGESFAKRIQLQRLLAEAEDVVSSGEAAIVVFYRLDRVSRNQIEQEAIIIKSFKTGVQFRSTDLVEEDLLKPEYQDDPMRVAMRQIVGVFAQLERATIQARLDGGLAIKASKGGFTGGRVPLGYKAREQELCIDDEIAPIIRRIFILKKLGISNTTILALCARDFPACRKWSGGYIGRILKRDGLYCRGEYTPRGGGVSVTLPNLIIVHESDSLQIEPVTSGEIQWDKVSDPIRLDALSLLLNASERDIKDTILTRSLPVMWRGNNTQVPLQCAKNIYKILSEQHHREE